MFQAGKDCERPCFDALRCVRAADQNMAAYNHPLVSGSKEKKIPWIRVIKN